MYSYFMLLGTIDNVAIDAIGIETENGSLEVLIEEQDLFTMSLKKGQKIGVKGRITTHGLIAEQFIDMEKERNYN